MENESPRIAQPAQLRQPKIAFMGLGARCFTHSIAAVGALALFTLMLASCARSPSAPDLALSQTSAPPPSVTFASPSSPSPTTRPEHSATLTGLIALPSGKDGNPPPGPSSIALGHDDQLWYASSSGRAVVRMRREGRAKVIATSDESPANIAVGPDGSIWYTIAQPNKIYQIRPNGVMVTHELPSDVCAGSIVRGADGAMWFIANLNVLGRISRAGAQRFFKVRMGKAARCTTLGYWQIKETYASELAATPDGSLWVVNETEESFSTPTVIRVSPDGTYREIAIGKYPLKLQSELVASDRGLLWFLADTDDAHQQHFAGFLDPRRHVHLFPTAALAQLVVDSHEVAWGLSYWDQTTSAPPRLFQITTSGKVTEFATNDVLGYIFIGWDGALWAETEGQNMFHLFFGRLVLR